MSKSSPAERTHARDVRRLTAAQVVHRCAPADFSFVDTTELEPLKRGIIGQPRAIEAMEFGLAMTSPGYNLFLSGPTGTGKTTYAETKVREEARKRPSPSDWCYVYNFDEPDRPTALEFPPGQGARFCKDMEQLVEEARSEIRRAFDSEEYESRRLALIQKGEREAAGIWQALEDEARAMRFIVQRAPTGIMTAPLSPLGKPYSPEQYEVLPDEQKEKLASAGQELRGRVNDALRRIRHVEQQTRDALRRMEQETGRFAVEHLFQSLKDCYSAFPRVRAYLDRVQADMIDHLESIRADGRDGEAAANPLLWAAGRGKANVFLRYQVNLFVSNGQAEGAPVVVETSPTYYNLVGRVEYEGELGTLRTNFTMVKPGALHRANGGYLIIQARDLLMNQMAWPALKRALKTGQVSIENLGELHGVVATTSLRPEPIPLNVKVILIGSPWLYQLLFYNDEDFRKYFKVKVDFDSQMPRSNENELYYAAFIASRCETDGLPPFDASAVARVIEYSSRLAGHREKLSTRFNEIAEIVAEAGMWARREGAAVVEDRHVQHALDAKVYRSNQIEERILEMIRRGTLLVDVDGGAVGQINGIAVLRTGDYTFGKPVRITARSFLGGRGVINIEREADLSGRIHNKGVLILSHYLGGKFAQNKPLALSASLAFEQSYDEVEGDSASAAELYTLLSELSGLPIEQGIAVTGSINQKGELQPIGGVNEKIEGFFHACTVKGLTGRQGVLIPRANMDDLMLKPEVVEAIEDHRFHVWAIDNVEEGIEMLTGVPAGEADENGFYPEDTVFGLVDRRLEDMAVRQVRFAREAASRRGSGANGSDAEQGDNDDGGAPAGKKSDEDPRDRAPEEPKVPPAPEVPGSPDVPEPPAGEHDEEEKTEQEDGTSR